MHNGDDDRTINFLTLTMCWLLYYHRLKFSRVDSIGIAVIFGKN